VFLFFADPANLPRVMPPWMAVRIDREKTVPPVGAPTATLNLSSSSGSNRLAGPGSEVEASYRAMPGLPFRIHSVAIITAFSMNRYFEDIQGHGPFKSWHHRHEFAAETRDGISGTVIRDIVDYEVGFGPLGSLANALFVSPQMKRTFAHRQNKVLQLLS